MTAILNSLVTVLGAWLVVSPYLLGTRGVALAIAIAAGAIALVLSIVAIKQEAYKPTLDYVLCALGIALALWGIVGWIAGLGAGLSEIIVGALVAPSRSAQHVSPIPTRVRRSTIAGERLWWTFRACA